MDGQGEQKADGADYEIRDPFGIRNFLNPANIKDKDIEEKEKKDGEAEGETGGEDGKSSGEDGGEGKKEKPMKAPKESAKADGEDGEGSGEKGGEGGEDEGGEGGEIPDKKDGEKKEKEEGDDSGVIDLDAKLERKSGGKEKEGEKGKKDGKTIDLDEFTDEEIAEFMSNVLGIDGGKKGGTDNKKTNVKDSDEYREQSKRAEDAEAQLAKIQEEYESMKRVVDKKGLRYQETSDRLEDVEMELARQQPYIDAIKSSDDMKQAMTLLARSERSQDESSKKELRDGAIDALYSYLEKETGISIRDIIDKGAKKTKESVKEIGKEKKGSVTVDAAKREDDVEKGILKGLIGF